MEHLASPSIAVSESPLLRLFQRKDAKGRAYISAQQFAAGEALRADFERAHLSPRVVSAYAPSAGSGGRHWQMSDNALERTSLGALAARDRLDAAFTAVGPELSGILYQVCCIASGFEAAEAALELPVRSGKAVLALALTRLARHYGLEKPQASATRKASGHWGMADYRPQIMPRREMA